MSISAYRVLESTFKREKDCNRITKKLAPAPSFRLGDMCDDLVDYASLDDDCGGEFSVKAGAILDFIASNPAGVDWDYKKGHPVAVPLDPDVRAALLEDVKGKDRDDDVRYECM